MYKSSFMLSILGIKIECKLPYSVKSSYSLLSIDLLLSIDVAGTEKLTRRCHADI